MQVQQLGSIPMMTMATTNYGGKILVEVKQVRFLRRKNLGNYEHEEVELFVDLSDGDDPDEAIAILKEKAEVSLGIIVLEPEPF